MFLQDNYVNKKNSLSSSGVYQDIFENWEIFKEINIFMGKTKTKTSSELAVHATHKIFNIRQI